MTSATYSAWSFRAVIGIAVLIGAVAALSFMGRQDSHTPMATAVLGGREFRLEVADTVPTQRRGLSGRREIPANGGMIFIFPDAGERTFWMKDMNVPIDIIWLSASRIIGIEHDVPVPQHGIPDRELERYTSLEPTDRVIELRAGRAAELGLHIGQAVQIRLP